MSQIPLTNAERAQAVQALGYGAREAEFLALAALHGGYFLRRQFCDFLGKENGGTAASLIEKALAHRHVKVAVHANNTHIYHLCRRPFFALLGQADNRNRRDRQPFTIKNKLMALDFVLTHRDRPFLATEQEKLDYFTGILRIPRPHLPARLYHSARTRQSTTRYFVDKYPIFHDGVPPVVSFCFVDEGALTASHFETWLRQYSPLFASLPEFNVVYVAGRQPAAAWPEATFQHFVTQGQGSNGTPVDPTIRRMLDHFAERNLYESQNLTSFDRARLLRLREERDEFSGDQHNALFERWKAGGDLAVLEVLQPQSPALTRLKGTFSKYILEHNYDFFGNLTAF